MQRRLPVVESASSVQQAPLLAPQCGVVAVWWWMNARHLSCVPSAAVPRVLWDLCSRTCCRGHVGCFCLLSLCALTWLILSLTPFPPPPLPLPPTVLTVSLTLHSSNQPSQSLRPRCRGHGGCRDARQHCVLRVPQAGAAPAGLQHMAARGAGSNTAGPARRAAVSAAALPHA